jgi:Fibronectin type III domain
VQLRAGQHRVRGLEHEDRHVVRVLERGSHVGRPGRPGSSIRSTYLPLLFNDRLDTDANGWSFAIGGNNTWNWVSDGADGGHLSDSPNGDYENDHESWAELSGVFDLRESAGCALTYLVRLDLAAGDLVQLEVSFDSGSSWTPHGLPLEGSTDGDWVLVWEDLSSLDGWVGRRVRFHMQTDGSEVADGIELDDVFFQCLYGPPEQFGWEFFDSTSLAAAHVAGAAANLKSRRQLATVDQLKGALLAGVDTKPAFAGTTATGGRLNLHTSHGLLKTVPQPPAHIVATAGNGQATVTWTPTEADGGSPVTEYFVTPFVAGVGLGPRPVGNVTQAVIDGLVNGTPYSFGVAAKNAVGVGPNGILSGAVTPRTVPGAPVNVRAQPENAGASIRWSAPEQDGGSPITGYTITPFAGSTPLPSFETGPATSTFASGLTNGTAYTFHVAAQSVWGVGPASVSNAVTPVFPTIAGAAKVAPAKPKAGSPVTATVRVTAGGAPVKPTRVACAGAIGKAKVKGKPRAAAGSARCTFKTPRAAKGKRLKGSVSFTARGKRFTKRFAAKLR